MRAPPIPRLLSAVRRRPGAVVAVLLVLAALSFAGLRRLSFDTDVLSLLPHSGRVIPAFRTFLDRFGSLDQLHVVFTAPGDHAIDEYRDEIDAWIDALRRAPEIARVDAGVADGSRDVGWLADHQLLLMHGETLDRALARMHGGGTASAVADARELLAAPGQEVADLVREDPLGLFVLLRSTFGSTPAAPLAAAGRDGYVTADGGRRLVIAHPRRPPYDAAFSRALDARLRKIGVAMAQRPRIDDDESLPPLQVEAVGGHRIAVETESVIRRESILSSVGSLAVILPLLFLVFRSVWLVAIGPLPAALSLLFVLGALGFAGTQLSAAGTGAAAMLFGLGIDGVVLLYVSHLLLRSGGDDRPEALAGPATSMVIGMWTTAATFYGLAFVDFPSLQQLGLLVGHSMLVCGLVTLVLVPALLPHAAARRRPPTMPGLARWLQARRTPVLAGAAVVTVALAAATTQLRVDPTLDRLRSVTDAARRQEAVSAAFGLPREIYVMLSAGERLEPLLEANERLVARVAATLPSLQVEPPTRLLPSARTQAAAAGRVAAAGLTGHAVRADLEAARAANGFREGSFDPFAARVDRLLDTRQRLQYDGYLDHGWGDMLKRFIVRDETGWRLATYVFPSSDEQVRGLQAIIAEVDDTVTLTGLTLVNQELARGFAPQFLKGLAIGAVLVVVLIVAAFRTLRLSIYALVPTVLGLVWTAGLLALAGVELDLFAVFGVVTLFGIGVDYGVHLVHRCHERGNPAEAIAELAPVILVAAAITALGYGTLITSSYPPLRSLGLVSVISVVALAAASVLVLPALLAPRRV